MNHIIRELDEKTINLIAAGEVVESPASVVKELIENSIDANAKSIVIEIKNGGKDYIRITDDGFGIPQSQVEKAFMRHTTSKLSTFSDFNTLRTNGFRGEALASIASVSNISITTKVASSINGTYLQISAGQVIENYSIGAKDGTTIIVEDLLFNTPARRNFLKSNQAESAKITDTIIKLGIIHQNIKFKYINNSKVLFSSYGNGSLETLFYMIYGNDFKNNLISVNENLASNISLEGILGTNSLMLPSRKSQHIYVNKRIVKSKMLSNAIEKAYKEYIPSGRYPAFALNINADPSLIDVNIHPNKLEIKFNENLNIYDKLFYIVKNELKKITMIPSVKPVNKERPKEIIKEIQLNDLFIASKDTLNEPKSDLSIEKSLYNEPKEKIEVVKEDNSFVSFPSKKYEIEKEDDFKENLVDEITEITKENINYKNLIIIGRVFNTYILAEFQSCLYLIDQHAAHERVLFEKYMNSFENQEILVQELIIPLELNFSPDFEEYVDDFLTQIEFYGFSGSRFSHNLIAIRGIPNTLDTQSSKVFLYELMNLYSSIDSSTEFIRDMIASKACKAAVKGNDKLHFVEINHLLNELNECKNKFACPHGRPIVVKLTKYEIEKMFKRII